MSDNETNHEWDEDGEFDAYDRVRKRNWELLKKKSTRSQKISSTGLFVIFYILLALVIDVLPMPAYFKFDIVGSWQFKVVAAVSFFLVLFRIWSGGFALDNVSFVELDERHRFEKPRYSPSATSVEIKKYLDSINSLGDDVQGDLFDGETVKKVERSRKAVLGYDFVEHMRSVIDSLDYQIDYAEEKASRLLESGRNFVKGGIWLYVFNIVLWQGYLYCIDFALSPGVIFGMVSSTMVFLIMEFLGAWYLKQYRHYGDSAFSYMKVRSSYNKYMLAYCAILEFTTDDYSAAKDDMLRVLAEPERWPDLKDVNSNDFNYMLQSVDSMGTVFERLKGVFDRDNGTGKSSWK